MRKGCALVVSGTRGGNRSYAAAAALAQDHDPGRVDSKLGRMLGHPLQSRVDILHLSGMRVSRPNAWADADEGHAKFSDPLCFNVSDSDPAAMLHLAAVGGVVNASEGAIAAYRLED